MAITLSTRATGSSLQQQHPYKLSRPDIAIISGATGIALVLLGILTGWLVRRCSQRRSIRERRKTRHLQRAKLHAVDPAGGYQRSYSTKTLASDGTATPANAELEKDDENKVPIEVPTRSVRRPSRPGERWKWDPPADLEKQGGVRIPSGAAFF